MPSPTSCEAGVVGNLHVHGLDAAEQNNMLTLVSNHMFLHADQDVAHCISGVFVKNLEKEESESERMNRQIYN